MKYWLCLWRGLPRQSASSQDATVTAPTVVTQIPRLRDCFADCPPSVPHVRPACGTTEDGPSRQAHHVPDGFSRQTVPLELADRPQARLPAKQQTGQSALRKRRHARLARFGRGPLPFHPPSASTLALATTGFASESLWDSDTFRLGGDEANTATPSPPGTDMGGVGKFNIPLAAFGRTPVILSSRAGNPDASPDREGGALLAGVYKLGMQKREQMAIGRGFE